MTVLVGTPSLAAPGTGVNTYIPPQWVGAAQITLIVSGDGSGSDASLVTYVFDAVLELEHEQSVEKTHHPVQTGSDISSHAYMLPARLSMSIGMSDAMAQYSQSRGNTSPGTLTGSGAANTWGGASKSKSVNAYQTLMTLQANRQPFTIVTRLRGYTNMILVSLAPHEDYRTITSLRARLVFEQIFVASTTTTHVSARADAADQTGTGTIYPTPVPPSMQNQFKQPPAQTPDQQIFNTVNPLVPATKLIDLTSDILFDWGFGGDYGSSPSQTGAP